ncbi:hypothetical protein SATRM34S_06202 [Streptomyces atroolivaceus]
MWRVDRARALAAAAGLPGYEVLQYQHSHLRAGSTCRATSSRTAAPATPAPELFGYLRAEPALTLVAYSPLLAGAYVREDTPLPPDYDHPGTQARLAALRAVARETGATVDQVVLAWQIGGELPVIPLAGASSLAQLEENLSSVDLKLTVDQRARLDAVH